MASTIPSSTPSTSPGSRSSTRSPRPRRLDDRAPARGPDDVRAGARISRTGRSHVGALPGTTRLRLSEIAIGVLLVAGAALGVVLWHTSSTSTRPALVLARGVERGHVFVAADFASAQAAAHGMVLLPYSARDSMVGRIAATDLAAATPVTDSVAVETVPIAPGEAVVARRLDAGEFPAGLAPGSTVEVLLVVETMSSTSATPERESIVLPDPAVVDGVNGLDTLGDAVVITLRLPEAAARQVAAADGVRLLQVAGS